MLSYVGKHAHGVDDEGEETDGLQDVYEGIELELGIAEFLEVEIVGDFDGLHEDHHIVHHRENDQVVEDYLEALDEFLLLLKDLVASLVGLRVEVGNGVPLARVFGEVV